MSVSESQNNFIDIVINLLSGYDELNQQLRRTPRSQTGNKILTPEEFIKTHFCEKRLFVDNMQEKCVTIFFEICSLRPFLDEFVKGDLLPSTPAGLVHIYLLLFYVSPSNLDRIVASLSNHFDKKTVENILVYLTSSEAKKMTLEKCSSAFSNECQQGSILKEIEERADMLQQILQRLRASSSRVNQICGLDLEEAHQMLLAYNDDKSSPTVDLENTIWSPRNSVRPQPCSIKTKYSEDSFRSSSDSRKLALDLSLPLGHQPEIKRARTLKKIEEEQLSIISSPRPLTTRRSRAPPEIKKTTAQVLREGARVQKKAEEAEKVLKDLCNGSTDPFISAKLLEEVREEENAMELREIERKHLLGLLSREEARIAKSAAIKANRMKALELKQQSQELERQLQEWRRLEMIRMREIAERNQCSMKQARLAQVNLLNKRKMTAKQIQEESRELQRRIEDQRKRELDQKISLIRQIKELEHLSKSSPNVCDNRGQGTSIGVSCQMSVIQLKEALAQVKEKIKEQIQSRRERIQYEHIRQQKLLQDTMRRIERYKNVPKPSKSKCNQKELVLTPDLIKLRKKLELKRLQAAAAGNF